MKTDKEVQPPLQPPLVDDGRQDKPTGLEPEAAERRETDWIWKTCVERMRNNPEIISWVLKTWTPEMEGNVKFLEALTAALDPEWWKRQQVVSKTRLKADILNGLFTLDEGRGIIADWLAFIIREEQDWRVLEEATKWKPQTGLWPAVLLDAWSRHTGCRHPEQRVSVFALGIIISADLSVRKSSANQQSKTWSEKERTDAILKFLSESKLHETEELDIIARAMEQSGFYDEKVAAALFSQWNRRMHLLSGGDDSQHHLWNGKRKEIWKEMLRSAPYYPNAADVIEPWVACWLSRETDPEILGIMAEWQPPDESRQRHLMELWGQCRVSGGAVHQWAAWKFGWRFLTRDGKPGPGWEDVGDNCLECLQGFLMTARVSRLPPATLSTILDNIGSPHGLTPPQQTEWEKLWIELLQSPAREIVGSAATHLLGLVADGISSQEKIKAVILERLMTPSSPGMVQHLLEKIRTWERNCSAAPEIFRDACRCLCQSARPQPPEIRLVAVEQLLCQLKTDWQQGMRNPELLALWLNILQEASDPKVVRCLGEWELLQRELELGKGLSPDPFQQSVKVWKERVGDVQPEIRGMAWKVLHRTGDATEVLLMECLSKERDHHVLSVMADWNLPPGKPLPPGFWDEWAQCLQEVLRSDEKTTKPKEMSGQAFIDAQVEKLGWLSIKAWFSDEQRAGNQHGEDLTGMLNFLDSVANMLPDKRDRQWSERQHAILKLISALREPPEIFEQQLSGFHHRHREPHGLLTALKDVALLTSGKQSPLTVNMMRNLTRMAVSVLDNPLDEVRQTARNVLINIWNHGFCIPDETSAGLNDFYSLLQDKITQEKDPKRLSELIQTGRNVNHAHGRRLLREIMHKMQESTNAFIANLAEQVFWSEVAVEGQRAKQDCPEGKKADWQTEWRRLRQFIHIYSTPESDPTGLSKTDKTGRGASFHQELWENLESEIRRDPLKAGEPGIEKHEMEGKFMMEEREVFFHDPRETGNLPSGRNEGLKGTLQHQPPISFAG